MLPWLSIDTTCKYCTLVLLCDLYDENQGSNNAINLYAILQVSSRKIVDESNDAWKIPPCQHLNKRKNAKI